MEYIIGPLITGGLALLGVIITNMMSNSKVEQQLTTNQAVTETKIDELSKKVEKHNSVIERVFLLEQKSAINEEKIKVANHRIDDLERKVSNER